MSGKTQSILFAGAVFGTATAVVALIPVGGCLCCLTYIGAGVLAIWHYTNTTEGTSLTSGEGAGSGALAGVVAAIVASILGLLFMSAGIGPDVETAMEEAMNQLYDSGQFDEEQLESIEELSDSPLLFVGSTFFSMIVAALLGAIGGALGVSWFAKKSL